MAILQVSDSMVGMPFLQCLTCSCNLARNSNSILDLESRIRESACDRIKEVSQEKESGNRLYEPRNFELIDTITFPRINSLLLTSSSAGDLCVLRESSSTVY